MRILTGFFAALLILAACYTTFAHAQPNQPAEALVESIGQQGIGFLSDQSLSQEQRKQKFAALLEKNFALDTVGRFAIGRYWRTATEAQRKEYIDLFKTMIINAYAQRFNEYKGQTMQVNSSRIIDEKDVLVNTTILGNGSGPDVNVDWRVRRSGNTMKVIDVIIEGISMSVTHRSEFSALMQQANGDISVLLNHLRK